MPSITDRKIASLVTAFEAKRARDPGLKLTEKQALELLAAAGDRAGWSASKTLAALSKPGLTVAQQVELAKQGLSAGEKADLATIVSTLPMEPVAKKLLQGVVDSFGGGTSVSGPNLDGGTAPKVDLKDPALHKDDLNADGTPKFGKATFSGPLFVDGVKTEDVQQGYLGDCYFPAAIAAIAQQHPDALKNMIKANGDGTYSVTFKKVDWYTKEVTTQTVKVDGDLYTRNGEAAYGRSAGSKDPKQMELWFPLLEKAWAKLHTSYNAIGNGGVASDVFEAVLGGTGEQLETSVGDAKVWSAIKKAIDAKKPVAAGTHEDNGPVNYTNTGVYGDHAYSGLGYEEKAGEEVVILRNPWGDAEPAGNGADDGVFKLKLSEFRRLYENVMFLK